MNRTPPRDPGRRRFLIGSALAGGTLVVGVQLPGCASSPTGVDGQGAFMPDACLRIGPSGIRVLIPHAEMGQGVMTALPMLIAEELDVDLNQIEVELAPARRMFDHPEWGVQSTGGSSSVRARFRPLRQAGAVARTLLVRAAAQRWGLDPSQCRTERGEVLCDTHDRRLAYSELAGDAAALALPDPETVPLKAPADFRLLGTRVPRVDIPDKVDGSAEFGIDVSLPELRTACVERPPSFGGSVRSFDATRALDVPGVERVVEISTGVAVVADGYWSARKGRDALVIDWDPGPNAGRDTESLRAEYRALAEKAGDEIRDEGDVESALTDAPEVFEASYELPYLAHATMEPMNATAHVREDACDVWAPTQSPGPCREVAVALTGLPYDRVRVQPTQMGGGFGRRAEVDYVAEAVEISRAVRLPVKVVWSREDDMRHDFYRPATHHVLRAALDAEGRATAWLHRIVGPSVMERIVPQLAPAALPNATPRFLKGLAARVGGMLARRGSDPTAVEGGEEIPYEFAHLRVEFARHRESFVPVGFWRSVGHSHNAFVVESFIDELAARAGADPYTYRRERLVRSPRHLRVLDAVAELAAWNEPAPEGRSRGIAVHASFGSYVAMVAEVTVDSGTNVRVHHVFVAVDCGQIVHPDTVEAQIEGALVYGLSCTLASSRIDIRNGGVVQGNFDTYGLLRMNQMPDITTRLLDVTDPPGGVGEIGTPPIAPAVANALFAATGTRLRSLPLSLM